MFYAREAPIPATRQGPEDSFQLEAHAGRQVVARFDGGAVASDAGALLLREAERRMGLLGRVAACIDDWRDGRSVRHSLAEMAAQRAYGPAPGYEDLNDHERLREEPQDVSQMNAYGCTPCARRARPGRFLPRTGR